MKEHQKELFIIYECYVGKVYENPVNFCESYGVDFYFNWLDKIDIKQCTFTSEKAAMRKLKKLRKFYLDEKKIKKSYKNSLWVGENASEGLHKPNQEEFEKEILSIFDRHYVVRKVLWKISIEDNTVIPTMDN